ncbi:hypothetical protein [Oceanobacillus massiliensis]|uniref:hypothetical protein n=1 Tax=Oceanobacillus massiliensis TaxID=1465765 RepID=UPI003018DB12
MMDNNYLVARLASLLEEEDPLVNDLIIKIVREIGNKNLSVEAHAKRIERLLDRRLQEVGSEDV